MAGDKDGKTEKPTPKKIKDSRKEGQFPRTPDAATWIGIAAGAALAPKSVELTGQQIRKLLSMLPAVAEDPTPARALGVLSKLPQAVLIGAAPVCLAAALGALLATVAQGVYPSGKVLKPKFSRLNPKEGVKRMFGAKAAWEAVKALLKVIVIAVVVVMIGRNLIPELAAAGTLPLSTSVARAAHGLETMIWAAAIAGIALAFADYAYQKHTVTKQLMMSPKDIRDEMKQSEGDPHVKGKQKQLRMQRSRQRMMAAVPKATVVVMNPTHYAVALKYEQGETAAPICVAKGVDDLALKIRAVAEENGVYVLEDPPLARALYAAMDVDEQIPAEHFEAVAKVIGFVMSNKQAKKRAWAD